MHNGKWMKPTQKISLADIWRWLEEVPDPEIPVIHVVEMGIIRDVSLEEEKVVVTLTPTYSGCPAMQVIETDIRTALANKGVAHLEIRTVLSPPWTTDWLTDGAKEKLRAYGIAPPPHSTDKRFLLTGEIREIACPRCGSTQTQKISEFGSTPCKALYRCKACLEPFDYFKCL